MRVVPSFQPLPLLGRLSPCHPALALLAALAGACGSDAGASAPAVPETCTNGVDDDGDGLVDCADADCAAQPACAAPEACTGGADEDLDGAVDCDDTDCTGDDACLEADRCADGADNDLDGDADCADDDCAADDACLEQAHCDDGADNDLDGDTDCDDPDCHLAEPCLPPFVLEAHTQLASPGSLVLKTNLPALVADCLALPAAETPCADLDHDGLADAWEDLVIDRYRPLVRLDEEESAVTEIGAVLADVARVRLVSERPLRVDVMIMLGYSKDYGSCGFTAHNGDSERVAVHLENGGAGAPGDVALVEAYTASHEGTANDNSMTFSGEGVVALRYGADPATGEPRWRVYSSQDKHATYANVDICENISIVPCVEEDCDADSVANQEDYDRLPPFVNAGEDEARLVTDLTEMGFPGDDAWADQDFCGGLGGDTCSAPVREKLVNDPFGP